MDSESVEADDRDALRQDNSGGGDGGNNFEGLAIVAVGEHHDVEEPPARSFVRVLSDRPGYVKTLSNFLVGAGVPLPQSSIALTTHGVHDLPDGPRVNTRSTCRETGAVMIATDFRGLSAMCLESECLAWEHDADRGEIVWSVPGSSLDAAAQNEIMGAFFLAGAIADTDVYFEPQGPQHRTWISHLQGEGLVTESQPSGRFQITRDCAKSVSPSQCLSNPVPVFAVRPDIALEDRTPYELIRMLREAGWTWSILPRTVQARKPLQYQRGSAQVWYSVSTAVVPDYLRCLLMSEEMFDQGLDAVPHYRRKVDDYRRLLYEGARLADLPAIEDSKKRPRPEVLEDEVDAPVEELDPFVDSDLENDMQALIDAEYAAACELEQLEPPPEDSPAPGGTTHCFPIEDVVPVELPDPTFPPPLALPDVPPPPLAPPALQDDPQHQERRGKKKAFIQEWGNGFTMRWSGKASIEMECLWHLKSAKTGCKNMFFR